MRMPDYEKAGWLADKIPAYGDYAKCAANLLRKQADQIVTITAALRMAKEALETGQDYASAAQLEMRVAYGERLQRTQEGVAKDVAAITQALATINEALEASHERATVYLQDSR